MNYTREQACAIRLQGQDIMVSAGAGAGKTRVLVDRLARRILDKEHPVSADHFLLMTFTEAAAAEMKDRIETSLRDRLQDDPANSWLRRQVRKIRHSDICTIHGFCSRLIRSRCNELGLDPAFRIGEKGELALMQDEAMEELLEESYTEGKESFLDFAAAYAPDKDDRAIESLIRQLYDFTRAFPDAGLWLDRWTKETDRLGDAVKDMLFYYRREVITGLSPEKDRLDAILSYGEAHQLGDLPSHRLAQRLSKDLTYLMEAGTFDEMGDRLQEVRKNYPAKRGMNQSDKSRPDYEELKALHDRLKGRLSRWIEHTFFMKEAEILREGRDMMPVIRELARLTLRFERLYDEKKASKNVYDFNDLEHFALKILVESYRENGDPLPTETARELAGRYQEIFVDEYQDINLIQETIIKVLHQPGLNQLFTVGDVKQSIYRFRQARPDLFLSRSRSYIPVEDRQGGEAGPADAEREAAGVEIRLLDNFRSDQAVIHTVNYIFRQLMDRDFGGVDYDDRTALRCGKQASSGESESGESHSDKADESSEMLFFLRDDEFEEDPDAPEAYIAETAMIGSRILELLEEGYSYGDMVILLRSVKNKAEQMADFLEACGIPTLCQNQTGYFETREIRVMMNYLAVIDNVYQDIPMASVMMSSIGNFTEDDMACLRIFQNSQEETGACLYDAMMAYPRDHQDLLGDKIRSFLDLLHEFREKKKETPLPVLLWDIYRKTGFYYDVQLMKDGENRKQNLLMLLKKARDYEQTAYKGLFYFNRYMKQLRTYEVDIGTGGPGGDKADRVRIMTIHKSKGLEFPVVFVSNISGKMNQQDIRGSAAFHPDLGIGLERRDIHHRIRYSSFLHRAIKDRILQETLEEELRVLYVAMTRAENKLILTGSIKESDLEKAEKWSLRGPDKLSAQKYMDWLLPALALNPSMRKHMESRGLTGILPPAGRNVRKEEARSLQVRFFHWNQLEDWFYEEEDQEEKPSFDDFLSSLLTDSESGDKHSKQGARKVEEDIRRVGRTFSYVYPYQEESRWKRKYSVSELKRAHEAPLPAEDPDGLPMSQADSVQLYDFPEQEDRLIIRKDPEESRVYADRVLEEDKTAGLSPSMRGTLVHKVMELIPFARIRSKDDLERELEIVTESWPDTALLPKDRLRADVGSFLFSEKGRMLAEADREGGIDKETPFTIGLPAGMVYPGTESEEMVIVQGIIDLYCRKPEGLWLVDYKTDRIREGEEAVLLDRYKGQMLYYKTALEQITGEAVVEIDLYSFALNRFIPVIL